MKRRPVSYFITVSVLLLMVLMIMQPPLMACAESPRKPIKLKVGWYPMEHAQEYDEEGNPCGLSYRYLQEISKYTGYEFEYVDGSFDQCMDWLKNGDIDMLFFVRYTAERASMFQYIDIPICDADSELICREENAESFEGPKSLEGKTVAVTGGTSQTNDIENYTKKAGVTCNLLKLDSSDSVRKAVISGKADYGMLISINAADDDLVPVERFDTRAEYMVLSNKRYDLLGNFDSALLNIVETNPDFRKMAFSEYFGKAASQDIILNSKEKDVIRGKDTLNVCLFDDCGYMARKGSSGTAIGIQADVAKLIAERLGMKCNVTITTMADAKAGKVKADLYGGITYDYTWAQKNNVRMTAPYMTYNYCKITNKYNIGRKRSVTKTSAMDKGIYFTDQYITGKYSDKDIVYENDPEACLDDVRTGKADETYLNTYIAQYYLRKYKYQSLTYSQVNSASQACFAESSELSPEFCTAVDKAIESISISDINNIIGNNMTVPDNDIKDEVVYHYPFLFLTVLILIVGIVISVAFLARLKKKNMIISAANKDAERANNAKTRFLSNMSHDMRTPMNAIIGLTYLAKDSADDPEAVKTYLHKINESGKFLLSLINDILDMSKIENGSMELNPEPYYVTDFADQVQTLIGDECRNKNIIFEINYDGTCEGWIKVDKIRLNQILFNLLSNSVKFTPEGGKITLILYGKREGEDKVRVIVDETDTGCGMTEEFQKKMYDAFSQSKKGDERGTGLGLAIVKKLVDLMNGTISVESALGKGTHFHVELMAGRCSSEEIQESLSNNTDNGKIKDESFLNGRKVLVCEDNKINVEIAEALLAKKGISVITAENGRIGADIFAKSEIGEFDAILMDMRMPVMDGLEATKTIRAQNREDAKRVPIIAMTANAFDDDRKATADAGMNAHLSKPVEPHELYDILKMLISEYRKES